MSLSTGGSERAYWSVTQKYLCFFFIWGWEWRHFLGSSWSNWIRLVEIR